MPETTIKITTMIKKDLHFLIRLWNTSEVMQYADEFPKLRGWTKSDDFETAWKIYQKKHTKSGYDYTQLILWLGDGLPIGESFFAPLPKDYTFGKWSKPDKKSLMGDIKLLPEYWGRNLGTEGMQHVVRFVFNNTDCVFLLFPLIEIILQQKGCMKKQVLYFLLV